MAVDEVKLLTGPKTWYQKIEVSPPPGIALSHTILLGGRGPCMIYQQMDRYVVQVPYHVSDRFTVTTGKDFIQLTTTMPPDEIHYWEKKT